MDTRHCPRCSEDLPLFDFGVARARKDGLNLYCRRCIREKIAAFRLALRNYDLAHGITRKTCKRARPVWLMKLKPQDAVLLAMQRGATSQKEIRRATRLRPDSLTDAIADLYIDGKLNRQALKDRRYVAA